MAEPREGSLVGFTPGWLPRVMGSSRVLATFEKVPKGTFSRARRAGRAQRAQRQLAAACDSLRQLAIAFGCFRL